jgi:hypothetical protein
MSCEAVASAIVGQPHNLTMTTVEQLDQAQWQSSVRRFGDYNYRQLWKYGEAIARRQHAESVHVGIRDSSELIGMADVRVKRLRVLGGGIAYVSGGPLTRLNDERGIERLQRCLRALQDEFVDRRGLILRVSAPLGTPQWNADASALFETLGFSRASCGSLYRTLLLDISGRLDAIRSGLAQKWRNCLNQAERNGLTVQATDDPSALKEFEKTFGQFVARKRFQVELDARFFNELQPLSAEDRFVVVTASKDGEVVGRALMSMIGDTCVYLLGMTQPSALNTKAAYLLQWQAIQHAKARGMKWYDLGGIDPDQNPGVYHFKKGLNGIDVTSAGPYESGLPGARATVVRCLEQLYRRARARGSRAPRLQPS